MPMLTDPIDIAIVNRAKAAVETIDDFDLDDMDNAKDLIHVLCSRITELVKIIESPW